MLVVGGQVDRLVNQLVEGDDGFRFCDTGDVLNCVDKDVHQALVVSAP